MRKYEAMFIVKPELNEEDRKVLFGQLSDAVTKNGGSVTHAAVWSERKKLFFPIAKHQEGVYYLLNFTTDSSSLSKINHIYKLNENILRVLVTVKE